MYSGLRNTNSYGLRLLSETKFLIIHGFSYKIKSYICVLEEIRILKSVDEGMGILILILREVIQNIFSIQLNLPCVSC